MGGHLGVLGRGEIRSLEIVRPCIEPVREADGKKVMSYGLGYYGYDIRLGEEFLSPRKIDKMSYIGTPGLRTITKVDPKRAKTVRNQAMFEFTADHPFWLPKDTYILATSYESFEIPEDVIGICYGKSSYARAGIDVNVTPLEPGWRGTLTMHIANNSCHAVKIYPGEGIAQIVFHRGEEIDLSYAGDYQNQEGVRRPGS